MQEKGKKIFFVDFWLKGKEKRIEEKRKIKILSLVCMCKKRSQKPQMCAKISKKATFSFLIKMWVKNGRKVKIYIFLKKVLK